jgi:hypothetical protein
MQVLVLVLNLNDDEGKPSSECSALIDKRETFTSVHLYNFQLYEFHYLMSFKLLLQIRLRIKLCVFPVIFFYIYVI